MLLLVCPWVQLLAQASGRGDVAIFVWKHLRYHLTNSLGLRDSSTKWNDCGSTADSSPHLLDLKLSVVYQDDGILLVSIKIHLSELEWFFRPAMCSVVCPWFCCLLQVSYCIYETVSAILSGFFLDALIFLCLSVLKSPSMPGTW